MRHDSLFFLFSPVTRIKGVGASVGKSLANLLPAATALSGSTLPIVRDLLFHLPAGILDRRFTCPMREVPPDGVVGTFVVTVDEHIPPAQKRFGKKPYRVICSNETGSITLVFFHAREDYIQGALPVGAKRVISGRAEVRDYVVQMAHPDIIAPLEQLASVQKPEPVYPLTMGLTSRRIARLVSDAMEKLPPLPEWLDARTVADHQWPAWQQALAQAHHPQSEADLRPDAPARARLAYDEMLATQLHLAQLRRNRARQSGAKITGTGTLTETLRRSLPFTLTQGQEQADREIAADLASGHRMGRLLQGDVGSGKTVVALLSMLRAAEQGLQSALMVPTELIAQQHYENIVKLLGTGNLQLATTLLTGSVKGRARTAAMEAIASGEAKIVIGTHALFQEKVEFNDLALVVIDEQHRFGVEQRMALSGKGEAPHLLHMSATPIPRSLTMTLYGDMDCSRLTEKPAGRKPITTRTIPNTRYDEVIERLKAALDRGEKAYWICPLIEEVASNEVRVASGHLHATRNSQLATDVAAAETRFTEFRTRFGNIAGLMHGRMKKDARDAAMRDFAEGKTRLLVATTVVEVGVDVPDATIMVVEQAERFGLAQLHQLRGRVGRSDKPSACVLLYSEGNGQQATGHGEYPLLPMAHGPLPRLNILRDTDDGFKIAEAALAQRGGGDLLGYRQSGLPRFIFADLAAHQALLAKARDEAGSLLEADPELTGSRGQAARILLQLFGYE